MIELVDPRGTAPERSRNLAPRRGTPEKLRRIGFLSNEPEHMTGPHFPGYTRVLEAAEAFDHGRFCGSGEDGLHLEVELGDAEAFA